MLAGGDELASLLDAFIPWKGTAVAIQLGGLRKNKVPKRNTFVRAWNGTPILWSYGRTIGIVFNDSYLKYHLLRKTVISAN